MSAGRPSLRHALVFALVLGLTSWLTMFAWSGLATRPADFLGPLLLVSLGLAVLGALLRGLRVPALLTVMVQLLVLALTLLKLYGGSVIPRAETLAATVDSFQAAAASASRYAHPIASDVPTIAPLMVLFGAVVVILVDLIAAAWGRVPLCALVYLLVYTLPVTIWGLDVPWWLFVLPAAGFLTMLFLREDQRFSQWGSTMTGGENDRSGFGLRIGRTRGHAFSMGAAAVGAAVLLPVAIPTLELSVFGGGSGPGSEDVKIVNPMTDLRRDLRQGPDRDLVRVTTTQADPHYLRFSLLTQFNGRAWTTGNRDIPPDQEADGSALPDPVGLRPGIGRRAFDATFTTTPAFDSQWLPTPAYPTSVDAPGTWLYDISTMDFISADSAVSAADLTYQASGLELDLTRDELELAAPAPGSITDRFAEPIDDLPAIVSDLAFEETQGARNDYERAVMLQRFFQDPAEFTYSTAPSGNSAEDIADFLTQGPQGRIGYCEQFASAFALMARQLGMPVRIAVGFQGPSPGAAPNTYIYSTKDMHAWPEVYISGAGWLAFEPTPVSHTNTVPSYTRGGLQDEEGPSPSASTSATPTPTVQPSSAPTQEPTASSDDETSDEGGSPLGLRTLLVLLGVLVAAALALLPRWLRGNRRTARWQRGTPAAAWEELRDSVVDLGLPWPHGKSPRETAAVVATSFADVDAADTERPPVGASQAPDASEALDRLVRAVEVERYAPRLPGHDTEHDAERLRADTEACVAALAAGVTGRARRRAEWLPPSLGRRGRFSTGAPSRTDSSEAERTTEHVGS